MMQKLNNLILGLIIGIVLPAVFYFIFVVPKMSDRIIFDLLDQHYKMKVVSLLLTRCVFPNALVFFLLIWKNQLKIAKGILISTAMLAGALVIINFI